MQSPLEMVTLEDFLNWEQYQPQRHELLHGQIIPFASTSFDHNHISDNVRETLNRGLPAPCYAYGTDIIIETIARKGESGHRADVVVTCSEDDFGRGRYLKHPRIIVEVRSPTNAGRLWDAKLLEYWLTASIGQVVVIETDERAVESYLRDLDGVWQPPITTTGSGVLVFPFANVEMPLDGVYRRTTLATAG